MASLQENYEDLAKPLSLKGKLTIRVFEAKDLKDMEVLGSMDPYVKIKIHSKTHRSSVIKKGGRSPVFNQQFTWDLEGEPRENQVVLDIYDKELVSDDHVGKLITTLRELTLTDQPVWYMIKDRSDHSQINGKVRLQTIFEGEGLPKVDSEVANAQINSQNPQPEVEKVSKDEQDRLANELKLQEDAIRRAEEQQRVALAKMEAQRHAQDAARAAQAQADADKARMEVERQRLELERQRADLDRQRQMNSQPMMQQQQPHMQQQPQMMGQPMMAQPMMQQQQQQPMYQQQPMMYQQQPQMGMGMGMQPQMGMGMGMQPQMGMGMQPQMGMGMQPQMGMGMQPQMGMGMQPQMGMQQQGYPGYRRN